MQIFELILQKNQVTAEDWQKLILTLANHVRGITPFTVAVCFKENLIRYFLVSKHDLSQLSTGVEGVIISPLEEKDAHLVQVPSNSSKIRFLKIPTGGTLLDLKERYQTRDSLELRLVRIDVQKLGKRLAAKMFSYFYIGNTVKVSRQQLALFPAHLLQIDFATNTNYLRKSAPKYLSLEKSLHVLSSDSVNAVFSVDTFPYLSQTYYLNLFNYEFDKHSFIVGSSGSGKSKLIELLIDRISKMNAGVNHRIVVIDPHAALADDLSDMPNSRIINFSGESTQLFPDAQSDISAATELTTTLFKSLVSDDNSYLERVLRFSLHVLYVSQSMSLQMLRTFLTDIDTRNQVLEHVKDFVPQNIMVFFGSDFNEIRTKHYNESIMPIVSLIDEMQMQPSLVGESELSLAKTIGSNFLTVFSLNKVSMGEKVVKTVAGLIIQQIFLLAQARVFGQKVILIIDEVSIVQNPAIAQILAEARKFNLSIILTQQYFGQIEKSLQDSILSNVVNYYVFKISEEDARKLEGNLEIALPDEVLAEAKDKGLKEADVRAKIMIELDPRECLIRISANGQILPCILARTMDAPQKNLHATLHGNDLEPVKQAKLPPKFDKEIADQAGKSKNNTLLAEVNEPAAQDFEQRAAPKLDTEIAKLIGHKAIDKAEVPIGFYRPVQSYGRSSLKDILAKHTSREKKVNKE